MSGYDDLPALMARMTGDEKHDAASFDAGRALGAVRPSARREPGPDRRPGPRPVPAVQGARPDGLLRGAGRQGLLHPRRAGRPGRRTTRRSATTRTASSCPGVEISLRLARPRPRAGRRHGARPAASRAAPTPRSSCWSATPSWTRAATPRRSSTPARLGLEQPHRGRRRQRVGHATAGRAASRPRFAVEGWSTRPSRRPRPRRAARRP